jgi:GT2 family glycosyltransferase
MQIPSVYILLLNWNGWADTIECLESLQLLTYPNYHMVILDNGSTDGSIVKIKDWAKGKLSFSSDVIFYNKESKPLYCIEYDRTEAENGGNPEYESRLTLLSSSSKLVIIKNNYNLGFSAGNNVGIKYCLKHNADFIWLLNNDTVNQNSQILNYFLKYSSDDSLCSSLIRNYYTKDIWYSGGKISFFIGGPKHITKKLKSFVNKTDFITGCNLFVPTKHFLKLGLLDERFFLGMEDCAFSYKLKKSGYCLKILDIDSVYHKVGATNKFSKFAIANSYICKSFWIKNTYKNPIFDILWVIIFLATNVFIRVPCKLLKQKIYNKSSEMRIGDYIMLSIKSIFTGFKVSEVTHSNIKNLIE